MSSVRIDAAQLRAERAIAHRADPLTALTRRDRLGNKLVDVVDPRTGFCVGVRSAGTITQSVIVPKGAASASHAEVLALPVYDAETDTWWVGEDRLVQRLVNTPDGPLKVARVVKASTADKLDRRAEAAEKVKRAPKDGTSRKASNSKASTASRVGKGRKASRPTDAQVEAYIRNKYGFAGSISAKIKRAAVAAVIADKNASMYF